MRVFALSDVHIDYPSNAQWLSNLSQSDYTADVLVLAGDVSDDPRLLERCFHETSSRFRQVLYVPGNHDLWVWRWDPAKTSLEKFDFIVEMARGFGVSLAPFTHGALTIVPLLSWYDYSFGSPTTELESMWMDYRACAWPENVTPPDVTRHFLSMNEAALAVRNETVVTFSHFLPRLDVMPSYIPAVHRAIYPVLGTTALDAQVRALSAAMHVYGHSHVNRRIDIDGVTYVNNAFGYPNEERLAAKALVCLLDVG